MATEMEETSNGKLEEESPEVETHDRDEKLKPEVESSTEEVAADGDSQLVTEAQKADDAEEKSPQTGDLVSDDTTVVPVETVVSSLAEETSEDVRVTLPEAVDQTEKDEELLPAIDQVTDVAAASVGLEDEEALQPSIEVSEAAVEVEHKGIHEPMQQSSDKGEVDIVSARNIDEQEIPILEENPVEPSPPAPADSTQASENAPVTQTRDFTPEATIPSPIIPLTQPTLQRTSWRSCCGLIEVLRRSDR